MLLFTFMHLSIIVLLQLCDNNYKTTRVVLRVVDTMLWMLRFSTVMAYFVCYWIAIIFLLMHAVHCTYNLCTKVCAHVFWRLLIQLNICLVLLAIFPVSVENMLTAFCALNAFCDRYFCYNWGYGVCWQQVKMHLNCHSLFMLCVHKECLLKHCACHHDYIVWRRRVKVHFSSSTKMVLCRVVIIVCLCIILRVRVHVL